VFDQKDNTSQAPENMVNVMLVWHDFESILTWCVLSSIEVEYFCWSLLGNPRCPLGSMVICFRKLSCNVCGSNTHRSTSLSRGCFIGIFSKPTARTTNVSCKILFCSPNSDTPRRIILQLLSKRFLEGHYGVCRVASTQVPGLSFRYSSRLSVLTEVCRDFHQSLLKM
jgi:hypothetical protein